MEALVATRVRRAALVALALVLMPGGARSALADRLYSATLRNGDYGAPTPGFIVDRFTTCADPDGSSCGDGNLSDVGITNTPEGVAYTNQHAVINFPVGRDHPTRQAGFRARGTVSFWFRAVNAGFVNGQPVTDNYGFNQFNSGQGSWGSSMSRHDGGTPGNTADDKVQIGWGTWHNNVWYYHVPAGSVLIDFDQWHHVGFVWGGTAHDFEVWVDGQLRAWNNLPAGVTKSWGSAFNGLGSGYNFALGEIHERGVGNATVYGVTFRDIAIWDEARPNGDFPMVPLPEITGVVPSSGPTTGGTLVRITGTEFFNASVTIGGAAASIVSAQPDELIVTTPTGIAGARDVVVTTVEGSATATGGFTYRAEAKIAGLGTGAAATRQPALDGTGRHLAFVSAGSGLVPLDTNGADDVFVRDRSTGATVRVSVATDGTQANGPSERPRLSNDGRFVVFVSSATNLVPGDTNGVADVFVHDRDADANGVFDEPGGRATLRVSVASGGDQADGASSSPDISGDGRWVAFASAATTLVVGDTNAVSDVFLHHWPSGQTTRVSVATGGGEANGPSRAPSIALAAQRVAFASDATNLVSGDTNNRRDVFVHDRTDGTTVLASAGASGSASDDDSDDPSLDDAGRRLAFRTRATNIVGNGPAGIWQVVAFTLPVSAPAVGGNRAAGAVVDIAAAIRALLSANGQGQAGTGNSAAPQVSGDGSAVAFESSSTDVVAGDTNGVTDVFVALIGSNGQPVLTVRISLDASGNEATTASVAVAISGNGRVTAFESSAPLAPGGSGVTDVFVRAEQLIVTRVLPDFAPVGATTGAVIEGTGFAVGVTLRIGTTTVGGPNLTRESETRLVLGQLPAVASAGPLDVVVTNPDGEQVTLPGGFTFTPATPPSDTDGDGLPDAWESTHGLDPHAASGPHGPSGDPDGDGVDNLTEYQRGTHPRGTYSRFLAEGATGDFFATRVALANPSPTTAAHALLRFQKRSGPQTTQPVVVPPLESRAVAVNDVPGMAQAEFATLVESDLPLVVDRTMTWDKASGYGMHAEHAVTAAATRWYLAEGATHSGFDLFYLLQNPTATDAQVRIRYLLPSAPALEKTYVVAAGARANVWVDQEQFPEGSGNEALANTDVSAVIDVLNGVPIIVERAMYLSRGGQFFGAGHESAGITAPALTWFLAEGATGDVFDLFLLFANPNASDAVAKVSYLLEDGRTFTRTITVPANSRQNIWVDNDTPDGTTGFPLRNAALSTKVEVLNGVPIIVERAMWWPGGPAAWYEAHNSPGSTVTGTLWAVANGEVGGPPANRTTYVLIANTGPAPADVRVTLLFEGVAAGVKEVLGIPPFSRRTLDMRQEFPGSVGRTFGVLVESLGSVPAPIAVECAIYQDAGGTWWAAGADQLATRLR